MMRSRPRRETTRARGYLTVAAAAVLLGGCEAARVAAPDVRPSPAENASAAAAALGVGSRADVLRAQAALAAVVEGWREPATAAGGGGEIRLDAETAARMARLQAQARAYVAQSQGAEPR
jgi:hypothetical protein